MMGIGAWELTIIFAIVLVLFGGKRLPSMATGLGQAIRNFRAALKGDEQKEGEPTDKNPSILSSSGPLLSSSGIISASSPANLSSSVSNPLSSSGSNSLSSSGVTRGPLHNVETISLAVKRDPRIKTEEDNGFEPKTTMD